MSDLSASALAAAAPALPPTVPEHVRGLLEAEIRAGRLAVGERIHEARLARTLGVSTTPVREALRMLERDGLVVRRRSIGAFVAPPIRDDEAMALYAIRLVAEPFLIALAVERTDDAFLERLTRIQQNFRAVSERIINATELRETDYRDHFAADREFHMAIYTQAESALTPIVDSYWARLHIGLMERAWAMIMRERLYLLDEYRERRLRLTNDHDKMIDALRARDPETAASLMKEHLEVALAAVRSQLEEGL